VPIGAFFLCNKFKNCGRYPAGQALRYNLFLFAEKANKKRIFTSILNANDLRPDSYRDYDF
jgi:hypothetical protein